MIEDVLFRAGEWLYEHVPPFRWAFDLFCWLGRR